MPLFDSGFVSRSTLKGEGHIHSDKWHRCIEHVKGNSPGVDPYAVCTHSIGYSGSINPEHRTGGRHASANPKRFKTKEGQRNARARERAAKDEGDVMEMSECHPECVDLCIHTPISVKNDPTLVRKEHMCWGHACGGGKTDHKKLKDTHDESLSHYEDRRYKTSDTAERETLDRAAKAHHSARAAHFAAQDDPSPEHSAKAHAASAKAHEVDEEVRRRYPKQHPSNAPKKKSVAKCDFALVQKEHKCWGHACGGGGKVTPRGDNQPLPKGKVSEAHQKELGLKPGRYRNIEGVGVVGRTNEQIRRGKATAAASTAEIASGLADRSKEKPEHQAKRHAEAAQAHTRAAKEFEALGEHENAAKHKALAKHHRSKSGVTKAESYADVLEWVCP